MHHQRGKSKEGVLTRIILKSRLREFWPRHGGLLALGLACLFSSVLIYSGVAIAFLKVPLAASKMQILAETLLLATALMSAFFLVVRMLARRSIPQLGCALASILYILTSVVYGYFVLFEIDQDSAYGVLACFVALADVGMLLLWGKVCAERLGIRQALLIIGLASVLTAAISCLYALLPTVGFIGLFVLVSIVAAVIPLLLQFAAHPLYDRAPQESVDAETDLDTESQSQIPRLSLRIGSLLDVILIPSLGMIAFAFVMAIMRTEFRESQVPYLAMLALCGLGIVVFSIVKTSRFSLTGGMQLTFLPVMALLLLAVIAITENIAAGEELTTILTYALYTSAVIITLSALCAVAHAGEFSSEVIFLATILAFSAASYLGQNVASCFDVAYINTAVTVITTVYAFILVLSRYVRLHKDSSWDEIELAQTSDGRGHMTYEAVTLQSIGSKTEDAVAQLSLRHKLTKREEEILMYLAERHNGAYIASVLFISPNTARTHIHNIYRKLGVSSREEILRLTHEPQ